ncbi:starch phosphorylase [Vigna unguiculata]|uniref:Protein YIP n=1 Tax=Vigna unguiculata TaxID=3917 RepID=A0A4D6MIP4_VIGUN|nr:starch phosphorylase [Vigna unguiculata]
MEESSYTGLPTSHLLGSVPAVITEENNTTKHVATDASMQIFPPNNGVDRGTGYQTVGGRTEAFEQQPANNWRGVFSISSYSQYFDVDTDIVVIRLISSLNPVAGDFFSKIDANPDLYGLIWISTTLVFVLAALGNLATYLMQKHADNSTSWSFDVSYMNVAACSIYGYAIVVPLAYYFFLQYMGSNASLIRFWCMWGYSLTIFIMSSFLLLIPVEFLRWVIILLTGVASASFVALNLRSYIEGNELSVAIIAAFLLQIALAIFIKNGMLKNCRGISANFSISTVRVSVSFWLNVEDSIPGKGMMNDHDL